MVALFVVLNQTDYLEDILAKFVQLGVSGATIIDSQGMAAAIVHGGIQSIPMFGSLKSIIESSSPYNKTIFTVIKDQELVEATMTAVKEMMGGIGRPSAGFMFTVPVGDVVSLGINPRSR
jgi:nitrogen regulatory protein P-II 1